MQGKSKIQNAPGCVCQVGLEQGLLLNGLAAPSISHYRRDMTNVGHIREPKKDR